MAAALTRRALAAGLLGAAAIPSPESDALVPRGEALDPIHAAIEAARLARGELRAAIRGLDDADPVSVRRADEACDRRGNSRDALSRTLPTTALGLRALVRFHAQDAMGLEPESYGATALIDVLKAVDALLEACASPG